MEWKGVKIIRIAELVKAARPLSASVSLNFRSTHSVSRSTRSSISNSTHSHTHTHTHSPNPKPNPRVLTALKHPAIVVGTLALPSHNSWSYSRCSCFQFSDGTCTVCCDVLEFDGSLIGKEIRVYAWNFIPFRRGNGGFLEIIKWEFLDSSDFLRKGLDLSNHVGSFPLAPSCSSTRSASSSSRHSVYGVIESVGPLSVVPCTVISSGSKSTEDMNSSSSRNLPGFLAQVICCECRLCGSKQLTDLNGLTADQNCHSFTKLVVVYFIDHASSWHSVIIKLIGNPIMVSGLKRKLVFIGKEESQIMYVTTDSSVIHDCWFSKKWTPCSKIDGKGKSKFGTYTGIITGIHMQGMAVELDHDVWLLLTDQMLILPHSLRVGAVISARNVHFVDPKFSWTNVLVLGACIKTSVVVESFSPLETLCHMVSKSQSKLGKFIESLPFSTRLWVLLLVSSLRQKFGGILSDKDLLGSQFKEGLAQTWASSQLPPMVFQSQCDAFMGLCRHDLCGCNRELHCGTLKLVIPMSTFICHCRATLLRMLKSGNNCKLLAVNSNLRFFSCEARSYGQSVRRIISSEDVGCLLLGYLKIAPSSGRLQLVDATGSIDVIIPDLPVTWDQNELYEVMDYNIIVDGMPQFVDNLELHKSETLSCRTIFNCSYSKPTKGLSILIHVHFLWKNVKCRNFPLHFYPSMKSDSEKLEPGTYHLLRVSHKFPQLQKMSSISSTFVEAMLLPWILLLTGKNGNLHPPKASKDQIKEFSESSKRQKLVKDSRSSRLTDEFGNSVFELSSCSNSFGKLEEHKSYISSNQIPCLVTSGSIQDENIHRAAILHSTSSIVDKDVDSQLTARKVLLELLSESFFKYQLQIGGYYILKHHKKDCFCSLKDAQRDSSVKVFVDFGKYLWSVTIVKSTYSSTQDVLSPIIDGALPKYQVEHLIPGSNASASGFSSDVCLHLPANIKDFMEETSMESEDQGQICAILKESVNISLSTIAAAGCIPASGPLTFNYLFPEGDLISLLGYVVDSHDVGSTIHNSCLSCADLDALQLKGFIGARSSLCVHVLVDQHIVKIFGSVRKCFLPTGFGPGVTATFHRILVRSQTEFMLLPVSSIVIKSITVYDDPYSDRFSNLRTTTKASEVPLGCFSSGLISELNQCSSVKQMWLRCRVVAVFVVFLESNAATFDLQAKSNDSGPLFDIPLAGFVLDDGSSSCCCWADAERAATLLRLQERLPKRAFKSSNWSFKWVGVNDKASSTATYHLGRMLKTYKKITVKNYGSCFDLPYQNHVSVTPGNALCTSDANLLNLIIFISCFGGLWNVAASVMNAEEVSRIKKEHCVEMEITHTMPNVWANEVCCMSTLTEARNMVQQCRKGNT